MTLAKEIVINSVKMKEQAKHLGPMSSGSHTQTHTLAQLLYLVTKLVGNNAALRISTSLRAARCLFVCFVCNRRPRLGLTYYGHGLTAGTVHQACPCEALAVVVYNSRK